MDQLKAVDLMINRFGKDELYTFLSGFAFSLVYFLVLITDSHSGLHSLNFYIHDAYYLTLFLIASWLFGTLILYVVYLLAGTCTVAKAENKFRKEYPQGLKSSPCEMINLKEYYQNYLPQVHLLGLISAALVLLTPLPWLMFCYHITVTHYFTWSIGVSIILMIFCVLFTLKVYFPAFWRAYLTNKLVNEYKIRVTYDNKEWATNFSDLVVLSSQNQQLQNIQNP